MKSEVVQVEIHAFEHTHLVHKDMQVEDSKEMVADEPSTTTSEHSGMQILDRFSPNLT